MRKTEMEDKKLHMEAVTRQLLEQQVDNYDELVGQLHQFTVGTLEYYLLIFVDAAFEGEMEMLPAEAQAAVHLNNMFSREVGDWAGMLSDMKQAAQCYPKISEHARRLAQYIREQVQGRKAANTANVQLQQMADMMKTKIRQMIEQGMYAEAKATVVQLRAIVPGDVELAELERELG